MQEQDLIKGQEHVDQLMHYGVKGMKWGVRKDIKRLNNATTKGERDKAISSLKNRRSKGTAEIAKLEKKNIKAQTVYEARIKRDATKSAKLERKAAKKKRKATGIFVTDGRSKELMYEAQILDAKVSTLNARVKDAETKVKKNEAMINAFKREIDTIDKALVEAGKKHLSAK